MYHIIVNPASKSGRGQKIWASIEPRLMEKKIAYDVIFSKRAGYVIQYVRELTARLNTENEAVPIKLIVLGGDGTLNEALQGISRFDKVEVGYIPTGSSNDMARDLQLSRDPLEILETILSGSTHRLVDIGHLTYAPTTESLPKEHFSRLHSGEILSERYFAVSCGIGFDAAVCEEALASRFKNALNKIGLGKLTYLIIALKQLITARKIACDIYLDDREPIHYKKFLFAAGMIHQYEGGGFKFCPGADSSDGLFDVCIVGSLPKPIILLALPTAFAGRHYMFPHIDSYRCSKLRIETSAPLWVHTDGEVQLQSRCITMTCQREILHLLV